MFQLLAVTQATFPSTSLSPLKRSQFGALCGRDDLSDIDGLICDYSRLNFSLEDYHAWSIGTDTILTHAEQVLKKSQSLMTSAATNYEVNKMATGLFLAIIATSLAIFLSWGAVLKHRPSNITLVVTWSLHGVMMFASSYVEEEQQFWYWMTSAWLFYIHIKQAQSLKLVPKFTSSFAILVLFRFARRWNQTGQKFAGDPDIATTFFRAHPLILWSFVVVTYALVAVRITQHARHLTFGSLLGVTALVTGSISFVFKVQFTLADAPELFYGLESVQSFVEAVQLPSLTLLARMTFTGLAILLAVPFIPRYQPMSAATVKVDTISYLHHILSLFLATQSRATNIPLFLVFSVQLDLMRYIRSENPSRASSAAAAGLPFAHIGYLNDMLTTLLLAHSSFFAIGNSNAISSIDLSNAYNGISSFNVLAVGILTFISNWTGPIWWVSAFNVLVASTFTRSSQNPARLQSTANPDSHQRNSNLRTYAISTLLTSITTLSVMLACLVLREHLFIWTVFSPKYLYQISWVLGFHFGVEGLLGSGERALMGLI